MSSMIRFTLCLLLFPTFASLKAEPSAENNERSVFGYSKEFGLSSQLRAVEDIVILKDGTLIQGEIVGVPALKFSFGSVSLHMDEVELISSVPGNGNLIKIQTRDNNCYIGRTESNHLLFKENRREVSHTLLDLQNVDVVLLKTTNFRQVESQTSKLHAALTSGEVFPVEIAKSTIELSDGWNSRLLRKDQVVSLEFNGGVYGVVLGEEGKPQDLPLSFSLEKTISFNIPKMDVSIRLPWDRIRQLCLAEHLSPAVKSNELPAPSSSTPPPQFLADHPEDVVDEMSFIETPPALFANAVDSLVPDVDFIIEPAPVFASNEDWEVPDVDFVTEPAPVFASNEDWEVPDVDFVTEPPRLFSDQEGWALPEIITFLEEAPLLFDPASHNDMDRMVAVGEDFDFEESENTPIETEKVEEEVQFVSTDKGSNGILMAVGEVFQFNEDEDDSTETEKDDDIEFIAVLESHLAVGEDFDFNGPDETSADPDTGEDVEFISRGYSSREPMQKIDTIAKEEQLAYRKCRRCLNRPTSDSIPHADFSMDEPTLMVEVEVPPVEFPVLPEEPQVSEPREGPSARVNVSKIQATPSFPYSGDQTSAPRVYDGLIYANAALSDGSGFYIKPQKVTNSDYKKFVDAINYRTPIHWIGGAIPSGLEDEPVVNVTYRDAFLYSVWAGKRLPTEEELSIAAEMNLILSDPNEQSAEWTSTPTMRSVRYPQSTSSVRMGRLFPPSHQVFSRNHIVSMNNDEANNYTGFRTAHNAH